MVRDAWVRACYRDQQVVWIARTSELGTLLYADHTRRVGGC